MYNTFIGLTSQSPCLQLKKASELYKTVAQEQLQCFILLTYIDCNYQVKCTSHNTARQLSYRTLSRLDSNYDNYHLIIPKEKKIILDPSMEGRKLQKYFFGLFGVIASFLSDIVGRFFVYSFSGYSTDLIYYRRGCHEYWNIAVKCTFTIFNQILSHQEPVSLISSNNKKASVDFYAQAKISDCNYQQYPELLMNNLKNKSCLDKGLPSSNETTFQLTRLKLCAPQKAIYMLYWVKPYKSKAKSVFLIKNP